MRRLFATRITPALEAVVARALPGATLLEAHPFKSDEGEDADPTAKAVGYGEPLRLRVRTADGTESTLVFHTAKADIFGHDRRADRAAEMLLAFDTFGRIPRHVGAIDVGAIKKDGSGLISVADAGEFYLVTTYGEGHIYADDLRRIAHECRLEERDVERCDQLARYLADLHTEKRDDPARYVRSLRDVVGSGEGTFGIIDGYPAHAPAASPERLHAIEQACVRWRWRLRGRERRLSRVHGDFHPFNVLFDDASHLTLLDAARGSLGDPADDVMCMAINYVFFALEAPKAWRGALGELWQRFFDKYLDATRDEELFDVAAPYLAWRGLVVCNPVWYPGVDEAARDRVLGLIERTLSAERFDPSFAEALFS
jgi:hypothetical protein